MAYNLFRGYIPTKNKESLMSFKNKSNDELKTLRDVRKLDEYAGVLNHNTILIDIDDYETSEIMMDIVEDKQLACRVYETTRGKHFLFKNMDSELRNKTGCTLACGLSSDIKYGHRNSIGILKYGGEEREIIYDILDDEDYQEVPKWMLPINTKKEFWKLKKGDGRNQEMFNYILTLQSEGFSKDEARECITLINDYVMGDPLNEDELQVVLRDDAFKKPIFFKGNTFLFDKFAKFLQSEYNIIKLYNQLYLYKDGVYVPGGIESEMIKHIPNLNKQKRSEVLAYLDVLIPNNSRVADARYIAFRNGIYDMVGDEMLEFTPSKVITNKINFDYNPKAYYKPCDTTLDKLACGDKSIRMLLEEVVGFTFYRRNELRKAFIFKGEKSNGKSTLLAMIGNVLGEENTCSLDLKDLSDRFKTAQLNGKLCNLGDDIGDEWISNSSSFKKLTSGDPMTVERKGRDPFEFKNYSKQIFSANNIPRMGRGKDSVAIIDRLVIVPFNARFSPNDKDYNPNIKYELKTNECMEYLIKIGIEGLKRVLKNKKFTTNEEIQKELAEYEESNNPMLSFFKELEMNNETLVNEPTKSGYSKYDEFCLMNNVKKCSHVDFTKQVKAYYGYEVKNMRVNSKVCRVFVNKEGE